MLEEITKWYWEYGCKRGYDPNDPENEDRKITLGYWLDPVLRIFDRNQAIKAHANQKPCLALWGPSQTGKSTLLSYFIDGQDPEGSDTALTWDASQFARFSPPAAKDGGKEFLKSRNEERRAKGEKEIIVFNPFNNRSDASGLATRYSLKSKNDESVNHFSPIEIKLTNRTQIILAISLGYLFECRKSDDNIDFDQRDIEELLGNSDDAPRTPDRSAFMLLKDIADAIDCMRSKSRFKRLFAHRKWENDIRPRLVSSSKHYSNYSEAEQLLFRLFWDNEPKLNDLYKKLEDLRKRLTNEWGNRTIKASIEAASILLDIDSYQCYCEPETAEARITKEKIAHFNYRIEDEYVYVSVDKTASSILSGDNFGFFQALCAELVLPLKKEHFEQDASRKPALELLSKCDILDFPGVSNRNRGEVSETTVSPADIDLSVATYCVLFTRVFKQGKTQCFVYNYVNSYGIDAFAILNRSDRPPSNASYLNDGVCAWISSYDPEWKPQQIAPLPVFIDMTFFASVINDAALSGVGKSLVSKIEAIQRDWSFAYIPTATYFATTYPQFDDGRISAPDREKDIIKLFLSDEKFIQACKLSNSDFEAVYNPKDGGTGYMLQQIAIRIDPFRRRTKCKDILMRDKEKLCSLILKHLPQTGSSDDLNKNVQGEVLEALDKLKTGIDDIEFSGTSDDYAEVANELKKLFAVPYQILLPIPPNASSLPDSEIQKHIEEQIKKWYSNQFNQIQNDSRWLTSDQKKAFLRTLRDTLDTDELVSVLRHSLGHLQPHDNPTAMAARYPFSLYLSNLLKYGNGRIAQSSSEIIDSALLMEQMINSENNNSRDRAMSPYFHRIIGPLLNRLDEIKEKAKYVGRPPQIGDEQLQKLLEQVLNNGTFELQGDCNA